MKFIFALLLFLSCGARAESVPSDARHVFAYGVISGAAYIQLQDSGLFSQEESYWYAVGITMAVSLTRESYDQFEQFSDDSRKAFKLDKNDLAIDLVGALIGPVFVWNY